MPHRALALLATAGLLLTGPVLAAGSPAAAEEPTRLAAAANPLASPAVLPPGDEVVSRNGRYALRMQGDGNAVVYAPQGPIWASGTAGSGGAFLAVQGDGNVVVYSAGNRPLFASGTAGAGRVSLVMQDDGNLVLYRQGGGPLWATGGDPRLGPPPLPPARDTLPSGATLASGSALTTAGGAVRAVMQADGNAVVYGRTGPRCATGTAGNAGARLVMQTDGNLVVHTPGGRPLWATGTNGNPGARAVVQPDENFVVYAADGRALWGCLAPPRPPAPGPRPDNPGNAVGCSDFATWRDAQDWFERYYPHYGDVAGLDADDDLIACEFLPGAP